MERKQSLLNADGSPSFGVYTGEIKDLSMSAYPVAFPEFLRKFRMKRWRFVGLFSPEFVCGAAVVDLGYVGSCFAYVFDLKTKNLYEFRAQSPLAKSVAMADHAQKGRIAFVQGSNRVEMLFNEEGRSSLVVQAQTPRGPIHIDARFNESYEFTTPHQVVSPTPKELFAFTHKSASLPAEGVLSFPGGSYDIHPDQTTAAVDHTAGIHDYHWVWFWASLGGFTSSGKRIGLNLVEPIHHPTINENALWVDGKRYPVGRTRFLFDRNRILEPWTIQSDDGQVDLRFKPLGERAETVNAGIILSRFHQPIGHYTGHFLLPHGEKIGIDSITGVAEDHEARW